MKLSNQFRLSGALAFAALVLGLGVTACNDEPLNSDNSNGGSDGKGDDGGGGDGSSDLPPVYALTARISTEEADTSYVLLTDDLAEDRALDLADAVLELPGLALGTGPEGSGQLFVASDIGSTVTRYQLKNGALEADGSVDFAVEGVSYIGEYGALFQYVGEEKAYWFSGEAGRIIIWNPKDMTVAGHVLLDDLVEAGQGLTFSAAPIRKGNKLYTFAAWHTPPPALTIVSRTAVIAIDVTTDEVEIVEDTRCGYVRDGVFGADGKLYLATEGLGAAVHFFDEAAAPAPCLLRFDTESGEFDAAYNQPLAGLFDGDPAGMLVVGTSGQAFLRVLDPALVVEPAAAFAVAGAPAWGWAKLTPGDTPTVERLTDIPLASARITPLHVDGKVYTPNFVDGESTIMKELTDEGPGADGLEIPGLVFSAVKLQ